MEGKKILVVDDEPEIIELYREVFTRAGYKILSAESAEEGLEIQKKENCWVAFLDLKLPDMNGVELCRKLKQAYPITIVYAVTGYGTLFELSDCREAGFDDYFKKPVALAVLLKAAENAFERLERWKQK